MKERLTGAIILVALIVLLMPELLTGPVRSAPRAVTAAAAAEGAPLRSYTINLSDDARARESAAGTSGPEQPAPLTAAAPAAGAQVPATTPTPAPAPAATPAPGSAAPPAAPISSPPAPAPHAARSTPAAPARAPPPARAAAPAAQEGSGQWVVQLGSFASRANAEHLAQQVRAGGYPVSVSQGTSGRKLYRVRVGPVRDRDAASQLQGRLQAAGHAGSVVPK